MLWKFDVFVGDLGTNKKTVYMFSPMIGAPMGAL